MTPQRVKNSIDGNGIAMADDRQTSYDGNKSDSDQNVTLRERKRGNRTAAFMSHLLSSSSGNVTEVADRNMTMSDLLEVAVAEATNRLAMTIVAVENIARLRTAMKMSCSRASGVKRELIELQKVLSGYGYR